MSLNQTILIGRLTKDPETKSTSSGKTVAKFTLAVDNGYGEKKTTDFLNVIAWEKTAEAAEKYLEKGREVCVVGRIATRNYDNKEGVKVYVTEVVAEKIVFLSGGEKKESKPASKKTEEFDDVPF